MTMHLAHPSLSTTGKRKGKQKFASAEAKRRAEELKKDWESNMKQWQTMSSVPAVKRSVRPTSVALSSKIPHGRSGTKHIPSIDSGHSGAVTGPQKQEYTGNAVVGIAVMHKSCLQPIFSQEAAIDSARMRRG